MRALTTLLVSLLGFMLSVPAFGQTAAPEPESTAAPSPLGPDGKTMAPEPSEAGRVDVSALSDCQTADPQSDFEAYCVILSDTAPASFPRSAERSVGIASGDGQVPAHCMTIRPNWVAETRTFACRHRIKHALVVKLVGSTPVTYMEVHSLQVVFSG